MIRRPPRSTRTDTLLPYSTLFRSRRPAAGGHGTCLQGRGRRRVRRQSGCIGSCPRPPRLAVGVCDTVHNLGDTRRDVPVVQVWRTVQHGGAANDGAVDRGENLAVSSSDERRVGKECVSPCRSRRSPNQLKQNNKTKTLMHSNHKIITTP